MSRKNKGFTLLELIVSLAIIVSVMFAFFKIYNSSIRVNTKNDRDIKALNLAQSELENLRNQIKNLGDKDEINIGGQIINLKELDKETINYEKNYTDEEQMNERIYEISLTLDKSDVIGKMYLFDINIDVNLKDKYFSKRDTKLYTSILSNVTSNTVKPPGPPTEDENPPEEEPNFKNGVAFLRYQNNNLVRGHDISIPEQTRSFATNGSNINKISIYFKKETNINKEYIDIYTKINGKSEVIRTYDEQLFKEIMYYPCKSIRFDLNTYNGGNVNTTINNIKINGKQVSSSISSTENKYYDFKLDESGDFELEFEIISNNFENPHFTVIFGK